MLFWSSLLQQNRIENVVNSLFENIHNPIHQIPKFFGIVADKYRFISNVLNYRIDICDQGITPGQFYSKLETLAILCELYSRFEFHPFRLNIQNGFQLNEVSAREIINNCQSVSHNPHLQFIRELIIPLILEHDPMVVFCIGKISYFHIAVAKILKNIMPNIHICITRHSSEYYSLNKITKYLKNNAILFSVIDSIILDNFEETEQQLLENIALKNSIGDIPSVLSYKNDNLGRDIKYNLKTKIPSSIAIGREKQARGLSIPPNSIYNIHFEPHAKCYWDKCVFCGINKKYNHYGNFKCKDQIELQLKTLCASLPANSFLWFIDEAIRPTKLNKIADYFILHNHNYIWQARCRIDRNLLSAGLAQKLALSGLKELRLGLESASLNVLRMMNKFEEDFTLGLVNQIVSTYSNCGISIHFPMIIGFPGEEASDRQKTYEFLATLCDKYPLVTFNINIFNFDVSSPLFNIWDSYPISNINFPCAPNDFIGNIIAWDGPTKSTNSILEQERNAFMRDKLYHWMPRNSLITPTIFYRLSETIRNTLIWKHKYANFKKFTNSTETTLQISPNLVIYAKTNGEFLAYNWENHHYIEGQEIMLNILDAWRKPASIKSGFNQLVQGNNSLICYDDLIILINKLMLHGHLLMVENKNVTGG